MQGRSDTGGVFKAAALIMAGCLVSFHPLLGAAYVWDDPLFFTHNPLVADPGGIISIWFRPWTLANFYPLVYTSFWIEHRIWGLSTAGCHGLNLAFHAANALLLFLVLRRVHPPTAFAAALLFALHPSRVEVVALASQRKDVMSVFFYLLAALRWFRYEDRPSRGGLAAVAGLFTAALLCKAVVCTLPAALFLGSWARSGRAPVHRWRALGLLLVIGLLFAGMAAFWERWRTGAVAEMIGFTPAMRIQMAGRAVWFYLGKMLWPANMMIAYPKWPLGDGAWGAWLFPVAAAAGLAGAAFVFARRALLALAFALVTILPALGFVDFATMHFAYVQDHYSYLAAAGVFMLAAPAMRLSGGLATAFRALLPAVLMLGAWNQSRVHRSAEGIWRHNVLKAPKNPLPRFDLGLELKRQGRAGEAAQELGEAVRLDENHVEAWTELAAVLEEGGQPDRAEECLRHAVEARAAHPRAEKSKALAHDRWGTLLARQGRTDEAVAHYEAALGITPDFPAARHNMGSALLMAGRYDAAAEIFKALAESRPGDAAAHNGLGFALAGLGRLHEAVAEHRRALDLKPDYFQARMNLGLALAMKGDLDGALGEFDAAAALAPGDPGPVLESARALDAAGRRDDALGALDRFLAVHPGEARADAERRRLAAPAGATAAPAGAGGPAASGIE